MKKIIATMGVLALLVGNSLAQDQPCKGDERSHKVDGERGKRHGMMADIPNLTEEQKTQIKSIREEGRKQSEPQQKQMKELRTKIHDLKTAENPDLKEINQLIDKSASVKAEMEKSRTASELKIRSILTPEQRKAIDVKHKENMELREKQHMEKREMRKVK